MKVFLLMTIFFFVVVGIAAQSTFQKLFYHTVPGIQVEDGVIGGLIVDANDNYVFAGYSQEIIQQTSSAIVYKTDENGNLIWFKTYALYPVLNEITSLLQVPDGGYLMTGTVLDSGFQPGTSFLMKTDTAGGVLWSKIFPFSAKTLYTDDLSAIGNYIYCAGTNRDDILIVKIDQYANIIWSKFIAQPSGIYVRDIVATKDSGCVFVGNIGLLLPVGNSDIFYGKLDLSGNKLWTKRLLLPGSQNDGGLVEEATDGGYLICTHIELGFGGTDLLIVKTDSLGEIIWSKAFGSPWNELPSQINRLADASFLITGLITVPNMSSAFTLQIDSAGNLISSRTYGLPNEASIFNSGKQHDDHFIYVGYNNPFPPWGISDVYLVKTDSAGFSGCFEDNYTISDSVLNLTVQDVLDSVFDASATLSDVPVIMFDATHQVHESVLCYISSVYEMDQVIFASVYPNPNNGRFKIQFDRAIKGSIILYNSEGKTMYEQAINNISADFSFEKLTPGLYFLRVYDNSLKSITSFKLIVQL